MTIDEFIDLLPVCPKCGGKVLTTGECVDCNKVYLMDCYIERNKYYVVGINDPYVVRHRIVGVADD